MDTTVSPSRRSWVVQLYFSVAALVGLGFAVAGVVTALFGVKQAALPELGLPVYTYEYLVPFDPDRGPPTEAELAVARERAIEDRRTVGVGDVVDGAILAGVGVPVLVWHLRRGRRAGVS
jgi:hypothetical protein